MLSHGLRSCLVSLVFLEAVIFRYGTVDAVFGPHT